MSEVTDLVSEFENYEEDLDGKEVTSRPATIRKELVPQIMKIQKKNWTFTVNYVLKKGLEALKEREETAKLQHQPKSGTQSKAS